MASVVLFGHIVFDLSQKLIGFIGLCDKKIQDKSTKARQSKTKNRLKKYFRDSLDK